MNPLGALMDQLLKDFELLSLPSRVNLEELSDSSIDRLVESVNVEKVFEALREKEQSATAFQWRKLREACLIKRGAACNAKLNISVYEESVKFSVLKGEMSECHIALSKLLELYVSAESKIPVEFARLSILFKYVYSSDGFVPVSEFLRSFKVHIQDLTAVLDICALAEEGNIMALQMIRKMESESFSVYEKVLIGLIVESRKIACFNQLIRAYPIVPVEWFRRVLDENDSSGDSCVDFQKFIRDTYGASLELDESMKKFVLKRKKK